MNRLASSAKVAAVAFLLLFVDCQSGIGRTEFTPMSLVRGCISNEHSIDKCVGVWEMQNVAVPTDRDMWIDLGSDGFIKRVSPDMAAWMQGPTAPRSKLLPGSRVLFDFVKDENVFTCPQRATDVGVERLSAMRHIQYRWWCGPKDRWTGRTRGTRCFYYWAVGSPAAPDVPHRN